MKNLTVVIVGISLFVLIYRTTWALDKPSAQPLTTFTPEQIEFLEKEFAKKNLTFTSVTFYGLVQLNANLIDSQRSNVPDFAGQHVRLGTKINGEIASAQIEVDLLGNQPSGAITKTDPISGTSVNSTPANGSVVIRQAQANLDVIDIKKGNKTYLTTISFGGVRVGGASFSAPDSSNVPTQYGRQDGIYLQEKVGKNNNLNIIIGLGVFNTLYGSSPGNSKYLGWGNNSSFLSQQSIWGSPSLNKSLAYIGSLNTFYKLDNNQSIIGNFYYGTQKNAPSLMNGDGTVVNVRDADHTEASLSYNDPKILGTKGVISSNGVSFWYEREANGRSKIASSSSTGMVDDSEIASLYGLGIAADSSPYLTGIIKIGDRLTYAASYTVIKNGFYNTSSQPYSTGTPPIMLSYLNQDYKLYQIAGSVGYAIGTFETAFNSEFTSSDTPIFRNPNSSPKNSEMKAYITASYIF